MDPEASLVRIRVYSDWEKRKLKPSMLEQHNKHYTLFLYGDQVLRNDDPDLHVLLAQCTQYQVGVRQLVLLYSKISESANQQLLRVLRALFSGKKPYKYALRIVVSDGVAYSHVEWTQSQEASIGVQPMRAGSAPWLPCPKQPNTTYPNRNTVLVYGDCVARAEHSPLRPNVFVTRRLGWTSAQYLAAAVAAIGAGSRRDEVEDLLELALEDPFVLRKQGVAASPKKKQQTPALACPGLGTAFCGHCHALRLLRVDIPWSCAGSYDPSFGSPIPANADVIRQWRQKLPK